MRIKCLLAVLACISFVCIPVNAQDEEETRHEVAISYGVMPNSIWVDVFTDVIKAYFGETQDGYKYVGPITSNNENGYFDDEQITHTAKTYFSFMPSVKFNWLRKKNWGMYSKLAAGATYINFDQDEYEDGKKTGDKTTARDLMFNFQASFLGVEAGNNHVRGFLELGVGEQGIALAGLRYKF